MGSRVLVMLVMSAAVFAGAGTLRSGGVSAFAELMMNTTAQRALTIISARVFDDFLLKKERDIAGQIGVRFR